jgi:hypothetical protein
MIKHAESASSRKGQAMQINLTHSKSTRRKLITLMGFALLTLCFSHVPAQAQTTEQTRQITIVQDLGVVGIVPGQTLSITLSNPEDSGVTVQGHVKILDGTRVVFETPEAEIAPGQFHSFEIDRADIALPGDPRTGRFQAAARLLGIRKASVGRATNLKLRIEDIPASIEIIDNLSGKTVALTTTKVSLIPIGGAPVPID